MNKWLQSTEHVLFKVQDRVATITLNRPEKRNAISQIMLREFHQALLEADDQRDVSVILLEGAGKDFCAGFDLAGRYTGVAEEQARGDEDRYRGMVTSFDDDCWYMERQQDTLLLPWTVHKPIVAKVHGNCLAGGTDIAFACDIVIASEDARIGFPAVRANGMPLSNLWLYHLGPTMGQATHVHGGLSIGHRCGPSRSGARCVSTRALGRRGARARAAHCLRGQRAARGDTNARSTWDSSQGRQELQRLDAELDARAIFPWVRDARGLSGIWPSRASRPPCGIAMRRSAMA